MQSGDTAGRIAAANKPASISLDQMLVAMLRTNPDAFSSGNINRLRAGAVLEMPSEQSAASVPADEARRTVVAQSRDFNEFRRRLAEGVPAAGAPSAGRSASGRVEAKVDDRRPAATAPDRLTLSKGGATARAAEDRVARERAARDQSTRVAELNRNITELNRLAPGVAAVPGGAASGPRVGVTAPVGSASAPRAGASAPAAATATTRPGSAPAATVPATAPASARAAAAASAPASARAATPATAVATPGASAPRASASAPSAAAASAAAARASGPASSPNATAPAPSGASTAIAPPVSAASAPTAAGTSAAQPASAARPASAKAPAPPPPPETSLVDDLLENPLIPGAVLAGLALLLGLGVYRVRQRRKTAQVDSSFLESRLQPDSFFGASGGQRVDTAESSAASATGSSMVYSPSQLDAAGDVDPVAEADVYLAYGRDLQAEEILKEALRVNPERVAIHAKLLEIYAKRRDPKAFEVVATDAYHITHGEGPEWEHICDLGRELDPGNSMYRPGGQPGEGALAAAAAAGGAAAFATTTATQALASAPPPPAVDLDLDLDFSLGDEPEDTSTAVAPPTPAFDRTQAIATQAFTLDPPPAAPPPVPTDPAVPDDMPPLEMDFDPAPAAVMTQAQTARDPEPEAVRLDAPDLTLDENSLNFTPEPPPPPSPVAPPPSPSSPAPAVEPAVAEPADSGMIEFDLGTLSLDLPGDPLSQPDAPTSAAPTPAESAPSGALDVPSFDLDMDLPASEVAPLAAPSLGFAGGDDEGGEDPLATKLALAEEFNAIGDSDGARSLAEEVLAEATGDLRSRAQRLLAEIG